MLHGVSIRMTVDEIRALKRAAANTRCTVSRLVRVAVRAMLGLPPLPDDEPREGE